MNTERIIRLYKGLPGCGKTTAARNLIAANPKTKFFRINNDEIAASITNLSKSQLIKITETLLLQGMENGNYILIDNTNLSEERCKRYDELVLGWNTKNPGKQYKIVVEDLRQVPLWVCHERNSRRENPVPSGVITDMFQHHILPTLPCAKIDPDKKDCVVIDLDGTIAKRVGRGPFDHTKYLTDVPYWDIWNQIDAISKAFNLQKIFLTGRSDLGKEDTVKWLVDNFGLVEADLILYMRDKHDLATHDYVFKENVALNNILPSYNIKAWFEDRIRCVEMARYKLGVQAVYQVNEGNF